MSYIKIIQSFEDADLNAAIKRAHNMFGVEKEATRDALNGNRRSKIAYLKGIASDPDEELVAKFFARYEEAPEQEEEAPRRSRRAREEEPAPRTSRRQKAPAKKPARRAAERDDSPGKIEIAGDPAKIAEALGSRVEVAQRGRTMLAQRQAFQVEALAGKGVVISEFETSGVNRPLRYVRYRLGGTPWIRKARVKIGTLSENKLERLGLRQNRDGTFSVEDRD